MGLSSDAAVWGCISVHQPLRHLPRPRPWWLWLFTGRQRTQQPCAQPLLNPPGQVSCPGVSSEYLDYLTPCMASPASCHLRAGRTMPPLVLLSPTEPWLACGFFLCLFQKPEPWTCPSFVGLPGPSLPTARSWRTDAALGHLSPAHLPCCPVYYTRASSLAVLRFGYLVVRRASPSCSGARQQGLPDQQPRLLFPPRNTCSFM